MIDVEKKIIYFGYGDVQVGHSIRSLCFKGFKPPIEVGTMITEDVVNDNNIEWLTPKIYLDFKDISEISTLQDLLKQVADNKGVCRNRFKFKDFTFDFSNYNEKSINWILATLQVIRKAFLQTLAC